LNSSADINSRDDDGLTPLMYAASHEFTECVDLLLSYGADTSVRDNENRDVMDFADKEEVKDRLLRSMRK
jgi:ankyrin repeat protein